MAGINMFSSLLQNALSWNLWPLFSSRQCVIWLISFERMQRMKPCEKSRFIWKYYNLPRHAVHALPPSTPSLVPPKVSKRVCVLQSCFYPEFWFLLLYVHLRWLLSCKLLFQLDPNHQEFQHSESKYNQPIVLSGVSLFDERVLTTFVPRPSYCPPCPSPPSPRWTFTPQDFKVLNSSIQNSKFQSTQFQISNSLGSWAADRNLICNTKVVA